MLPTEGRGAMDLSLGRIEYQVRVGKTASYDTIFKIEITDSQLGPFRCVFSFHVIVDDRIGGPRAIAVSAAANGRDSSEFFHFYPGNSNFRCEVFPMVAGRGPSMYIYS
jgi:hypothetical protein